MKVAVIGAGPSGLFLAILLKQRLPAVDIQVYEQNPRDATFGFGVVLADTGLANLQAAAPDVCRKLVQAMRFSDKHSVVTRDHPIVIQRPGQGGGAIPRIVLLSILQEQAQSLGIDVAYGQRCADYGALRADLVVGADGVNSLVRESDGEAFGVSRHYLSNHFAWYGVGKAFPNPALVFRKHLGGYFVAHYYPYSEHMSTFVAECDRQTWLDFGMEDMSEDARRDLFQEIYAPELDGHALISNNSVWRQFPVVRAENWHAGNKVLVGDALNSAHFSIGSGTRIAMEDSIALAQALQGSPADLGGALRRYVRSRKPQKQKLIRASEASFNWYENMRTWMDTYSPHEFVLRFMTRTGRVDAARLRKQYPTLVRQFSEAGLAEFAESPA